MPVTETPDEENEEIEVEEGYYIYGNMELWDLRSFITFIFAACGPSTQAVLEFRRCWHGYSGPT